MATPKMQKRQTGQKSVHILLYLMMRGDMTPKKSASPETASLTVVFAHSGRSRGAQKRSSGTADTHTHRQTDRDESAAGQAPVLPRGHGHGRTSKSIPFTGVPPLHSNPYVRVHSESAPHSCPGASHTQQHVRRSVRNAHGARKCPQRPKSRRRRLTG